MKTDIDMEEVKRLLDDPANKDEFDLARRFGGAVRRHFKGRATQPDLVIRAAMGAVSANIKELDFESRVEAANWCMDSLTLALSMANEADPGNDDSTVQ